MPVRLDGVRRDVGLYVDLHIRPNSRLRPPPTVPIARHLKAASHTMRAAMPATAPVANSGQKGSHTGGEHGQMIRLA